MTETKTVMPQGERSAGAHFWVAIRPYRAVLALLILLIVIGGITQPAFLTWNNVQNVLTSQSVTWIVALAMTFVLISAGLDLSVGAIATFAGVTLATLVTIGVPSWLTLIVVVLIGTLLGGLGNGMLVGKLRLSVFVVTLATMTLLTGVIQLWTGSSSVFLSDPFFTALGSGKWMGMAIPVWIMILTFAAALFVERYTYFGRDVFAVGGSPAAAELSGIRSVKTLVMVYAISGGAAALAGSIAVGRIGAATAQVDAFLPLQAIAAVLLGGTLLTGGAGSVIGTALGVLFIGGLGNLLSISDVPQAWQQVLTGVILVLSVLGDRVRRVMRRRDPRATSG